MGINDKMKRKGKRKRKKTINSIDDNKVTQPLGRDGQGDKKTDRQELLYLDPVPVPPPPIHLCEINNIHTKEFAYPLSITPPCPYPLLSKLKIFDFLLLFNNFLKLFL